jgi:hypothetical protein
MRALLRLLSRFCFLALMSIPAVAQRYTEDLDDRYNDNSSLAMHLLGQGIGEIVIWIVVPIVAFRFVRSFFAELRMSDEEFFLKYPHRRAFGRDKKPGILFYAMMAWLSVGLLWIWMLFAMPETLKALMT